MVLPVRSADRCGARLRYASNSLPDMAGYG
ncbi:hypothetical protein QFZ24_007250 [Streptomyces phaeochromogenes]|uniref:Uncharacterized protein n=1 Tax=Streptomyces umbrinus TaxID=67370 RepID=A0ABU0T3E4_9ACTN|nr:hypothetical protein [Streptomyces umbrinus]MDQ0953327.1 hypothetical protein [Streptomyces phaeochromogenes]MDQ1030192.1 hypothetical protein [Streptomyces umbrinus]